MRSCAPFAVAFAAVCAACSSPSSSTSATAAVDSAAPPPTLATRFRGQIVFDIVPLGAEVEGEPILAKAREAMPSLLACMQTLPPKETDLWVVGLLGEDGKYGNLSFAKEVPPEVASCATKQLSTFSVTGAKSIALSLVLHAEPAPDDCKGSDCVEIPGSTKPPPADFVADPLKGRFGMVGLLNAGSGDPAGAPSEPGGGASNKNVPSLRTGPTSVVGSLPAEVVTRIVRRNFPLFRTCYDDGLKNDPKLSGEVRVSFVISKEGEVQSASNDKSGLSDAKVVSCIVDAFKKLAFPKPESGVVKVGYSLDLAPAPPARTIGGASFTQIDGAKVAEKLGGAGWRTMVVPAAKAGDPFVVFAMKADDKLTVEKRTKGFMTALTPAPTHRPARGNAVQSEGIRFVAMGTHAPELLEDLVDPIESPIK